MKRKNFLIETKNNKQTVICDNEEYVFKIPQKDQTLLFKCVHPTCSATLKLSKNKSQIVGGTTTHARHITSSSPASSNSILKSSNQKKIPSSKPAHQTSPLTQPPPKSLQLTMNDTPKGKNDNFNDTSNLSVSAVCGNVQTTPSSIPMSPSARDVIFLKEVNFQLLRRIKSLEDELRSVKLNNTVFAPSTQQRSSMIVQDHLESTFSITAGIPSPSPCPPSSSQRQITPSTPITASQPVHIKPRLLICGDSFARDCGWILQQLLPEYKVQCHSLPGAPLSVTLWDVNTLARTFTKKDVVFILSGSNDVPDLTPGIIERGFQKLEDVARRTNLVWSSVPYKFDDPKDNANIFASNQFIFNQCLKFKSFYFECNFFLSRRMFTRHGFHLNSSGKQLFCKNLSNSLLSLVPYTYGFLLSRNVPNVCLTDDTCNNETLANISPPTLVPADYYSLTTLSDSTFGISVRREESQFFLE
ncbi:uncharacterized protein LOC113472836 [Diaphorina citri]|uniref:Uncharacterized protein LOC113472836 n=1 Tax=Diaphorina citri TaxID=121845 RepID=A0A3Q0JJ68_DIACI|nr:uncharacterized protein LOC113472836 [Diaphorina citri]